ncbi:MAG: carbamoyltransferase N-terminal domain-containing protein, partial [candidate division Zixibacteria bacterium]|nr:carbamoyltransferase N-terminal domain-containing protein [candidate division Zixibacteria bacterium]
MKILGISCFYHDAAAAIVVDGMLVAGAAEERFSRIKHDQELPRQAAEFCLKKAGVCMDDLDYLVFYDKPFTKFDRLLTGYMATPFRSFRAFLKATPVWLRRKLWIDHIISRELQYDGEILYVPHHLSHAAGAFFGSSFEKAAILTIDGVGEWATASYGIGDNNRIRLLAEMTYPHSVGLLYSAFTYYLGFRVNSGEYKVMGLAPFGTPKYVRLIEQELVRIHEDGSIHLNMDYFTFHYGLTMTGEKLERLFGHNRRLPESALESFHEDIAASIQTVTEKIVLKMARHVREETGLNRLCLAGGVALNCKATGRLLKEQLYDRVYVQPAAGDSGGAVGAALYVHHKLTGDNKKPQPFFGIGSDYSDHAIADFLGKNCISGTKDSTGNIITHLAQELITGKI